MGVIVSNPDLDTDDDIADIAALSPSDGDMLYWAAGSRYNTTPSTSYMRGLLNTASEEALKAAINAEAGVDFVAYNGALGTPSSGVLTNATGLPISTGVAGLGTGVATALAVNVGSAGAPVVNGGALGTPASGNLVNLAVPRVVSTYAAMTALASTELVDNRIVKATARATDDDGGEQEFFWDAAATDTDDDATILAHDSVTPGRFKALNIGGRSFIRPEQYGADGTTDNDTAAFIAMMALGKIIECRPNRTYKIKTGLSPVSNTRLIGNGATIEVQVGTGGFNSTDRSDKFNTNGQNTCLFAIGNGVDTGRENIAFHDLVFTASASTERVLQLIVALLGFSDSQLRVSDILIKDINCHGGGGFIAASSLGDGSAFFENIIAQDCGITGTTWTGTPQMTVLETDSDLVGGTPSKPGTIRGIRARSFAFSGSALSTYGNETDVLTLAGTVLTGKSGAWDVSSIFGRGVGEVVDCMANGATLNNIRGESVTNFVLKLVHGARYCVANNISGSGIGGALITLQGTGTASSGDTLQNVISNATVEDFDTNEASAVLIAKNTGTVGVPKKNTIYGLRVLGDSNGDFYVKDNCDADADNDNRVYMIDGSAAGTAATSIVYSDNTKVQGPQRGICQLSLGANQALTTLATLDFSVATFDPEGIAVTGSDKVTVKWPGLYLVKIALRFATDLDDGNTVEIRCVGGGVTQVFRQTIGAGAEQDTVTANFHVHIKEEHIGGASADIYAQGSVEGASDATVITTAQYTGMWFTRVA